jgi:hypothetical protein
MNNLVAWKTNQAVVVEDNISDPGLIAERALQLRPRERDQIAMNLSVGNYEMASVFVWTRTMSLLKKQLGSLGNSFIGELLQRPDIDESTDLGSAVSETEAISLARDLGILTPLQTKRLLNSQTIVAHFAGGDVEVADDEGMTLEEAVSCLRVCVQGVLGQDKISAAEDFKAFRLKLEAETLSADSPEIGRLDAAPYFFVRTAISILLNIFRTSKGAQLEHASRNAQAIIPRYWATLKDPERWQIGQAYAQEFNDGRKDSVKALHSVLIAVNGFDYVPENLRSATFVRVAAAVIAAHQGMNNFYNEPAPMRELASLGSSIPNPALANCMTAALCVRLGNPYGVSSAAQPYAKKVLESISNERWIYYLNGRLEQDLVVLPKLLSDRSRKQWMEVIAAVNVDPAQITNSDVRALIRDTLAQKALKVDGLARKIYARAVGV